jgi:acyl-CoA thioesterase-1
VVGNFGRSGATLLRRGDLPYWRTAEFHKSRGFAPDWVLLMLGTNDSKPQNYERFGPDLARDMEALVGVYAQLASPARVAVMLPPPVFAERWGIRAQALAAIRGKWREVSAKERAPLVDLHEPLLEARADFPDGVHPAPGASRRIAELVYRAVWGNPT